MPQSTKKPQLRFKGFTDDWEQRKLGMCVLIERGGSPRPIDEYITNDDRGLNWIKIGDAPEQGNYITKTAEKIKITGLSKTRQVVPGDLILSNSMSFGRPYIMAIDGCIHDGWLVIRNTNDKFDLIFLCHLLGIPQMLEQYKSLAAGSTVNNLNKDLVGSTSVSFPQKREQKFLGELFNNIDNLIILQQRKLEKLKNVKKSMLEKMFAKNGSIVPEIRFKGFTDDWKQRKLGEVAKYKNGKAHENYILDSGRYIVVNSKFVSTEGKICKYSNKQIEPLYINDIAFVLSDVPNGRALARTYFIEKNNKYTLNQRIAGISPNEVTWPYYLYILMNRNKYFLQFDDGAKQTNLSLNDVMGFEEYYPPFSEQKKIGEYFAQIDNLITLHQRKLEKLQNIKKACLEKMFV